MAKSNATRATNLTGSSATFSSVNSQNNGHHHRNSNDSPNAGTTSNDNSNSNNQSTHGNQHHHPHRSTKSSLQRDKFCDNDFDKLVIDTTQKILREKSYRRIVEDCCEQFASPPQTTSSGASVEDNETHNDNYNGQNSSIEATSSEAVEASEGKQVLGQKGAQTSLSSDDSMTASKDAYNDKSVDKTSNGAKQQLQSPKQHHEQKVTPVSDNSSVCNQPKRPMNAFMVWGQAVRRELHHRFSNVQNALLSKALGRVWRSLDPAEKEPYIRKANIIKAAHKRDYPNYRYQPRRIQERQQVSTHFDGLQVTSTNFVAIHGDKQHQQQVLQAPTSRDSKCQNFQNNQQENTTINRTTAQQNGLNPMHKFPNPMRSFISTENCIDDQLQQLANTSTAKLDSGVAVRDYSSNVVEAISLSEQHPNSNNKQLDSMQLVTSEKLGILGEAASVQAATRIPVDIRVDEQTDRSKYMQQQQQDMFDRQQTMMNIYHHQNDGQRPHHTQQQATQLHNPTIDMNGCYNSRTSGTNQYDANNSNYTYLIGPQFDNSSNNSSHHQHGQISIDDHIVNNRSHDMPYHLEMNFITAHDSSSVVSAHQQYQHQSSTHLYHNNTQSQQSHHSLRVDGHYENHQFLAFTTPSTNDQCSLVMSRGCDITHNQAAETECHLTHNHQHQNRT